MVDTDRLRQLAPHYVALLVLLFLVLGAVRVTVGRLGFWIELAIPLVVVLLYPFIVRRLGVAPDVWEEPDR